MDSKPERRGMTPGFQLPGSGRPLSRRRFLATSVTAAGALALAGCSWTPRNASTQQSEASPESRGQNASSDPVDSPENAPVVNDNLILVQGGTFAMGSPESEPWRSGDEALHEVTLSDFYLSPTEVSQLEYHTLMGRAEAASGIPVTNVTWYDAIAYCNALSLEAGLEAAYSVNGENVTWNLAANGYRLPTEAEWE